MPTPALALAAALMAGLAAEPEVEVAFRREGDALRIEVGGRPFATYVFRDPVITRPYFAHVRAPDGTPLTRNHPPVEGRDLVDHATFHPGIWLAFGDLGGADSWRLKAPVEHARFVEEPRGGPGEGTFAVENVYRAADGRGEVCREICRYAVLARPAGTLLVARSEFRSGREFAFGDQEEMGLGFRVATPLTVANGGRLLSGEGRSGEAEVRGTRAAWCDYSGVIDGTRVGLLLAPDPANFRPSWYHARDYGLLVANPFGASALTGGPASRVAVTPGTPFRLGFAVLAHSAPERAAPDPDAAYRDILAQFDRLRAEAD